MDYIKNFIQGAVQVKTWKQVIIITFGLFVYWALRNNPKEVQKYKNGQLESVIKYR